VSSECLYMSWRVGVIGVISFKKMPHTFTKIVQPKCEVAVFSPTHFDHLFPM